MRHQHSCQHLSRESLSQQVPPPSEDTRPRTNKILFIMFVGSSLWSCTTTTTVLGEYFFITLSSSRCELLGCQVEDVALHG